jgi:hypothetical protein
MLLFGEIMYSQKTIDKFNAKYVINQETGCWEWMGHRAMWQPYRNGKKQLGYGVFHIGCGKTKLAHRFSWEAKNGPIPEGLCCLHKCDNPACVNPEHIFLGTRADNAADREKKGRTRPHLNPLPPMLFRGQAEFIKVMSRYGMNSRHLAEHLNVQVGQVQGVIRKQTFQDTTVKKFSKREKDAGYGWVSKADPKYKKGSFKW